MYVLLLFYLTKIVDEMAPGDEENVHNVLNDVLVEVKLHLKIYLECQ
jgi:hypothetical protein